MSDEEKITDCYKSMYRAMIDKDIPALKSVLDDSFVLIHMTGMRQTKDEFAGYLENGTLNYYSEKDEQLKININGDYATLIGRSRVNAAVFGGGRNTWRLQLSIALVKKGESWLMTEAKASAY